MCIRDSPTGALGLNGRCVLFMSARRGNLSTTQGGDTKCISSIKPTSKVTSNLLCSLIVRNMHAAALSKNACKVGCESFTVHYFHLHPAYGLACSFVCDFLIRLPLQKRAFNSYCGYFVVIYIKCANIKRTCLK